jgi:CheY-like chemotaxis protein
MAFPRDCLRLLAPQPPRSLLLPVCEMASALQTSIPRRNGSASDRTATHVLKIARKVKPSMSNESTHLRVLIVDDEPLICWALAETLSAAGDVVAEAGTAKAAIHELTTTPEPIDVVLLDHQLPDCRDLGLLSKIRELAPQSQVILMSAYCTPEIATDALTIGAYRVMNKPLEMHELPELVREAACSRQAAQATDLQ